jgi:hypothetical protein
MFVMTLKDSLTAKGKMRVMKKLCMVKRSSLPMEATQIR